MLPKYDLDKIKFATDGPTFSKAVVIYESEGVKNFSTDSLGFSAKVRGSGGKFYSIRVSAKSYDMGNCSCYLGQNDMLCKPIVATALYAVKRGDKLSKGWKKVPSTFSYPSTKARQAGVFLV